MLLQFALFALFALIYYITIKRALYKASNLYTRLLLLSLEFSQ